MDSALKRTCAFIQRKFLSWPVLCMEISLHHVHHWPNQKQRIMICFSLLWVGLIWITDMKIPQDVLKMISGHVVAEKWHVKSAVSTPILFSRKFLENSHNNKMSYKYLHLIWTCIFPIIQSCTRILVNTITQQFNRIFIPIVFCLSEFCVNIFISIFIQYCPHSIFKKTHQKLPLDWIYLDPCSFERIPQIYIYLGDQYLDQA